MSLSAVLVIFLVFFVGVLIGWFANRLWPLRPVKAATDARSQLSNRAPIYELLVNTVKDYAIFILDIEGHVLTWNKGAQTLKGYAASDIIGSHFSRFYSAADVASGKCEIELEGALETGRFEDEGWRYRKDGSRFWANVIITTLRDPDGTPIGFAKVTRDLTERQMALEKLKKSELQLREAQSLAQVGHWEWDIASDTIQWSDELFKIFDLNPAHFDPSFQAYLARMPEKQRDILQTHITKSLKTGRPFSLEYPVVHSSSGETHFVHSLGRVIYDDLGKPIAMRGTSQDITERKIIEESMAQARTDLEARVIARTSELESALERETKAKEAKMQFLANMSHEIRTPMNAILGFSDLLSSKNLTEDQKYYLDRVQNNGRQLLRLIDDILDLSKFEAGRLPTENIKFSLAEVLLDLAGSFSVLSEKKGVQTSVVFKTPIPESIVSDSFRLRQILTNLMGNALKFTDSGSIQIHLSYESHSTEPRQNQGQLNIDVLDTGIGISREDQGKLFKSFSQADSSIVRKFGGTGLGLALSKHIAGALGGDLTLLNSEVGLGSAFRLALNLSPSEDTPWITHLHKKSADRPQDEISLGQHFKAKILLAEDSPDNQMLIRLYLNASNIELDIAQNGFEAVEMAKKSSYDCILMDIQMPGMDGLAATRTLRAQGFKLPIIALTAHALRDEMEKSMKAGCNMHLTKPIQRSHLLETIQHFVN